MLGLLGLRECDPRDLAPLKGAILRLLAAPNPVSPSVSDLVPHLPSYSGSYLRRSKDRSVANHSWFWPIPMFPGGTGDCSQSAWLATKVRKGYWEPGRETAGKGLWEQGRGLALEGRGLGSERSRRWPWQGQRRGAWLGEGWSSGCWGTGEGSRVPKDTRLSGGPG